MIERKRVTGGNRWPAVIALGGFLMFVLIWSTARTKPPSKFEATPTLPLVAQQTPVVTPTKILPPAEIPLVYAVDAKTWTVHGFDREPRLRYQFIDTTLNYGSGRAITLGHNGKTLFIVDDTIVRSVDIQTGVILWQTPLTPQPVYAPAANLPHWQIALSPDESILVVMRFTANGEQAQPIVTLETFEATTGRYHGSSTTTSSDWSPNLAVSADNRFAVLPSSARVALIDLASGERHSLPKTRWIPQLAAVSGDGQTILVLDTLRTVHVLALPTFDEIRSVSLAHHEFMIDNSSLMATNNDGSEITLYTTIKSYIEESNQDSIPIIDINETNMFYTFDTISGQHIAQAEDKNIGIYSDYTPTNLKYVSSGGILIQRTSMIDWFPTLGDNQPFYELKDNSRLVSAIAGPVVERKQPTQQPSSPQSTKVTIPRPPLSNENLNKEIMAQVSMGVDGFWNLYADGTYVWIGQTQTAPIKSIDSFPSFTRLDLSDSNGCGILNTTHCSYSPDGNWVIEITNQMPSYSSMLIESSMLIINLKDNTKINYIKEELPYENAHIIKWEEDGLYLIEFKYFDIFSEPNYTRIIRIDPFNIKAEPVELWNEPRGATMINDYENGLLLYTLNPDTEHPFELMLYNLNTQKKTVLDIGTLIKHDLYSISPNREMIAFVHRSNTIEVPDRLMLYYIKTDRLHHFGDYTPLVNYPIQWSDDSTQVSFFVDNHQFLREDQPEPVQRLVFDTTTGGFNRIESMIKSVEQQIYITEELYPLPSLNNQESYAILEQSGPLLMLSQYRYNEYEPVFQIPVLFGSFISYP